MLVASRLLEDIFNPENQDSHVMPFPKEGGEEELGVTIHIYEYYRWLPSLRSVGFNVPSPESPDYGPTL